MFKQLHAALLEKADKELEIVATRHGVRQERDYLYAKGLLCRVNFLTSIDDEPTSENTGRLLIRNDFIARVRYELGYYMGTYKRIPDLRLHFQGLLYEKIHGELNALYRLRDSSEVTADLAIGHLNRILDVFREMEHPEMRGAAIDAFFATICYSYQPFYDPDQRRGGPPPTEAETELFMHNEDFRNQVNFGLLQLIMLYPPEVDQPRSDQPLR